MPSTLPFKKLLLALGDVICFVVAVAIALLLRHGGAPDPSVIGLYRFAMPFLAILWLAGFLIFGLYDFKLTANKPQFFERLARAILFNLAVTIALFYLVPELGGRPITTLAIIFAILALFATGWRAAFNKLLVRLAAERVLFLGVSDEVIALGRFLAENPQLGFTPALYVATGNGVAAPEDNATPEILSLSSPDRDLQTLVRDQRIQRIVMSHDVKRTRALVHSLFDVIPLGVTLSDFPRFYEAVEGKVPVSLINEMWFLENLIGQRRPRYEFAKRILDLLLAVLFGIATFLLVPFIASAIVLSTPKDIRNYKRRRTRPGDGIIFFRQPRVGKNGAVFNFVKFRSQVLGAESMGSRKESLPDERSYPLGEFLRKTYLDELPQLWNVIVGEMSFVGPRPERPEFVSELERDIPFYRMRELVLPGITGWAQINMENDFSVEDAPEKLQYDLYYIKNRSLFLDITILLKTVLKLLQRSGR